MTDSMTFKEAQAYALHILKRDKKAPVPSLEDGIVRTARFMQLGLYYKYPDCCVIQFSYLLGMKNISPALYTISKLKNAKQYMKFKKLEHIPCDICLKHKM